MPSISPIAPGFMVVHANRPETLRELMAAWMARAPLAPLEDEVVLVQSNGVAQWLKLQLAADEADGGLGIAAALRMQLPAQFAWNAYRAVLGPAEVPARSPLDQASLAWRLMRLLPQQLDRAEFEPLRRFLAPGGAGADDRKLHQLCVRLAGLYDQYQVYRADWLADWARGKDVLQAAFAQPRAQPPAVEPQQAWQPALWRCLREDVGTQQALRSRAEVHGRFLQATRDAGLIAPAGVPRRIVVFGVSSMPQQVLDVLAALAPWSQVLLFVHNPCRHDWSRIVPGHELLRAQRMRAQPRTADGAPAAPSHPLLAAWGRQGRDFIRLLDAYDEREAYARRFEQTVRREVDCFESHQDADPARRRCAPTLLQRLQDDMLDLRSPAESRAHWPAVAPADRSLSFHVAHSPQREVEVLHDRLLAAFAADPTLTARDVIVMVPDVAVYAPHVQAVFGQFDAQDARCIPYGIADRGQRRHDALLAAVEQLLALPQSRLGVSEVLDLLDVPALRRRFGIDESELPLLRRWAQAAQVRWGLHAAQRASLGLPAGLEQNSWRHGLRRMFLGYAVGSGEPWSGVAPMDEVGGLDAALLGPLSRLFDALDAHWQALAAPATPELWCERLSTLLGDFFDPAAGSAEGYTLMRLQQALSDWQDDCAQAAFDGELALAVVREHWLERMDAPSLAQAFFSGGVTFASLMPMRAIPFRFIALLGMNDGDYPRSRPPMDFDLMARELRPGDRSRREDDRYLFLEALLSARDRLHLSWVGRSVRSNEERPPSVLVAQLRDHVADAFRLDGADLLQHLTVIHRLQPFHADHFDGSHAQQASYAREWRSGAAPTLTLPPRGQVLRTSPSGRPGTPTLTLPPRGREEMLPRRERTEPLELRQVVEFARAPVRFFFRERLGLTFGRDDAVLDEHEPFAVDGLERWRLQDELIGVMKLAVQSGADAMDAVAARAGTFAARGCLPAGPRAMAAQGDLLEPFPDLVAGYLTVLEAWPQALPDLLLDHAPAGELAHLRLSDWLAGLRASDDGRRARIAIDSSGVYGTGNAKNRKARYDRLLPHWVMHLAGHLGGEPLATVVVSKAGTATLQPLDPQQATALWQELMLLLDEGLRRPLPFAVQSACAWFTAKDREQAREVARVCYEVHEPDFGRRAELRGDPHLQRAYPDFESLWSDGRFADLARQLLQPLDAALLRGGGKEEGAVSAARPPEGAKAPPGGSERHEVRERGGAQ